MVKGHNVKIQVTNQSSHEMTYQSDWFHAGRLADAFKWPEKIASEGGSATVLCYERDNYLFGGCSGYVTYEMAGKEVTIAFSNPLVGTNKLNIATDGDGAWNRMDNRKYEPFQIDIVLADNTALSFKCSCTGGATNECDITIVNVQLG